MTYPKVLVSIQILYYRSKCLRIEVAVKAFCRYIKVFLASRVRKSIPELISAKLVFDNSDFLDLINFSFLNLVKSDFLDLAKFATVDRFLILLLTLSPSATEVPLGTS